MRAQVVIDRAGRVMLTVPGPVTPANVVAIRDAFNDWRDAQPPELLVVPEADVVRVETIELAIPEATA